jgi:hypothetical protein
MYRARVLILVLHAGPFLLLQETVYNILHFITREVSGEGETKEENGSADIILTAAKELNRLLKKAWQRQNAP